MNFQQLSIVVSYCLHQPFFATMMHRKLQEVLGNQKIKDDAYIAILYGLIFEGEYEDQTPFEYFLRYSPLSNKQKESYLDWENHNHFSVFEILSSCKSKAVVNDILEHRDYTINRPADYFEMPLAVNNLISARLIPHSAKTNLWEVISGNIIDFPKESVNMLKRDYNTNQQPSPNSPSPNTSTPSKSLLCSH